MLILIMMKNIKVFPDDHRKLKIMAIKNEVIAADLIKAMIKVCENKSSLKEEFENIKKKA